MPILRIRVNTMFLEKIEKANDIKKIAEEDYGALAEEIRQFLIQTISVTGGHLGSNLGAVELTMALHLFLNLPEDKISLIHIRYLQAEERDL